MTARVYIEEITDPVTGEVLTLRATNEAELDTIVAERFEIGREDVAVSGQVSTESADPAGSGDR